VSPHCHEHAAIEQLFESVRREGRDVLLETEGLQFLQALDLPAPPTCSCAGRKRSRRSCCPPSRYRVAVKVISPQILHKSDVAAWPSSIGRSSALAATIGDMHARLGTQGVVGYTISEFVGYSAALGKRIPRRLALDRGCRAVVTVGAGGIYTEFLAHNFTIGRTWPFCANADEPTRSAAPWVRSPWYSCDAADARPAAEDRVDAIATLAQAFIDLGARLGSQIAECEVNPFVLGAEGRWSRSTSS